MYACIYLNSLFLSGLLQIEIPRAVYTIWAITLAIVVLVIVPLAIYLLHRTYQAARNIERYFAEMAEAGSGVVENTRHIQALQQTIESVSDILSVAGNIVSHSETVKSTLSARATGLHNNGHRSQEV